MSNPAARVNVGRSERWASVLAGTGLILNGLARPSTINTLLALGGVSLIQRGATGHSAVYDLFGVDTKKSEAAAGSAPQRFTYGTGKRGERSLAEADDEASALSFPASDPPAWTTSTSGHPAV